MIRNWCAIALAALSMSSVAATASDDITIDTVTVEADRRRELLERQLSTFASAITMPGRDESLARWQVPICPLVAGLTLEKGTFVFERISQLANEAGAPSGPRDCIPNLWIVMTRDPEALLKSWWDKHPDMFNDERGIAGIKRWMRTPAPVRVFYNACSVPPQLPTSSSSSVVAQCGKPGVPGSRLRWSAVRVLYSAVIVVDKRQTEHLELGLLTDYIAMISLAQVRSQPDLDAAPTVLRLFDESDTPQPQGLSPWDRAFLKSLYATDPSRVTQLAEIKHRMKRDLAR
jgi:hypothetical protein